MSLLLCILLWAPIPDLDESGLIRVVTAGDATSTVDEAALYALLENVSIWPGDLSGSSIFLPDYQAIRSDPKAHRGLPFQLEGSLELVLPSITWSRSGWEGVRGMVVRPPAPPGDPNLLGEPIIVYVTNPPAFRWRSEKEGIPTDRGAQVRLVGRFLKTVNYRDQNEQDRSYLVFVGKWMTHRAGAVPASGPTGKSVLMFIGMILLAGFVFWRLHLIRRRSTGPSSMADYLLRKEANRQAALMAQAQDESAELPKDPAQALDVLAERKERNWQEFLNRPPNPEP